LRGNADRAVVMGFDGTIPPELQDHPLYKGDAWAATLLSREQRDFLEAFPALVALTIEGLGEVLFCHASARSDEERVTIFTPDDRLARVPDEAGTQWLVCGHTHRQFDRTVGGRRIVNAGSIGRPYECAPGAYWLRVGPDFRLMRSEYDIAAADALFRATGYPAADLIFDVGDPDERARHYERAAAEPVASASLIDPSENPLADRVR
jgi:diadenosine tetraphosphatase ApaH/serine/threonine PP2A family protein phosphatase